MGTISKPITFVDGTIPTAAQFNNDFDTIYNEFNGSITNANISASAAIAESKLAFNTSTGHDHDGTDSKEISLSWSSISATLTYSSADAPVYVVTTSADLTGSISVGMKIRLTHSSTTKYFIVVAISGSSITLYGGTDYTLAAGAITSPSYSTSRVPYGFPANPTKWTVETTDTSDRTQASPVSGTWYNLGSLSHTVPIGAWYTEYLVCLGSDRTSGDNRVYSTLSTGAATESDPDFTALLLAVSTANLRQMISKSKTLVLTVKTPYFLNAKTTTTGIDTLIFANSSGHKLIIRSVCAYL